MEQSNSDGNRSAPSHRTGKVERLIDDHELTEIGDEFVHSWTGDVGERRSLRDLADYFNRQLLRAAMDNAEAGPREDEVDQIYRLLTADDVSSGARTRIRGRLEQGGIDVEQLESDFVSHLAVRTYLRHRGATRTEAEDD